MIPIPIRSQDVRDMGLIIADIGFMFEPIFIEVPTIYQNSSYNISINKPGTVNPICYQQHPYSIYLLLNIPVLVTPFTNIQPTTNPNTYIPPKVSCGDEEWCYNVEVYPVRDKNVSETVFISHPPKGSWLNFSIRFM